MALNFVKKAMEDIWKRLRKLPEIFFQEPLRESACLAAR